MAVRDPWDSWVTLMQLRPAPLEGAGSPRHLSLYPPGRLWAPQWPLAPLEAALDQTSTRVPLIPPKSAPRLTREQTVAPGLSCPSWTRPQVVEAEGHCLARPLHHLGSWKLEEPLWSLGEGELTVWCGRRQWA
jgi:hypothetical protein